MPAGGFVPGLISANFHGAPWKDIIAELRAEPLRRLPVAPLSARDWTPSSAAATAAMLAAAASVPAAPRALQRGSGVTARSSGDWDVAAQPGSGRLQRKYSRH
jgi:hypothetical protein